MKKINSSISSLFGALLILGLFQGCQESPVGTDNVTTFQVDKISLSSDEMPEVDFYANENGIEISEIVTPEDRAHDRAKGPRADAPGHPRGGNDGDQAGPADLFRRILGTLELTERQRVAIARCFEAHEACVESATRRARAVRTELHDALVAKITRIRNAVADGSLTRKEGHRLIIECLKEYRKSAIELSKKYREALRACAAELKECIEGYLTPEQLRRFRALLDQAGDHDDDGDKVKDDKRKDDKVKDDKVKDDKVKDDKRKDDKRKDKDGDDGDDEGEDNGRGE